MENRLYYYKWFRKVMSVFIDIFFIAAPLASLYVFTTPFQGVVKFIVFAVLIIIYGAVIYFFKDKVKVIVESLFEKADKLSTGRMAMIIVFTAILLKIISMVFFRYDATSSGDIGIYYDIAQQIVETGNIHSRAISHLYGLALHLVVFMLLHIPLDIGMFIVFLIGTVLNFYSFKDIIGKNKAFFTVMIYLLMPSSFLISYCITHEIFVYMYVSLFLFFYNRILKEEKLSKIIIQAAVLVIDTVLTCFVNPGGYILYIIMVLTILLSNVKINKKIVIGVILLLSILGSNLLSDFLEVNEFQTTMNTYTILIHGTNPESLGEQVDGYPLKQMRMYIYDHGEDFSHEGFLEAARNVFIRQCIYLLVHPLNLIRLIAHKIYILWSGVHYPMELANHFDVLQGIVYYLFLAINTVVYLFMNTLGLVFHVRKDDEISISNYKLEFLGVIALTLFCIVVNKYSIYVTLFLYLISIYRMGVNHD